jgi:quercetin dioxygenase-like cupin family protein
VVFLILAQPQIKDDGVSRAEGAVQSHVLEENAFFRAVRLEMPPGTKLAHVNDEFERIIIVLSGETISVTNRASGSTVLTQGNVLYIRKNSLSTLSNSSATNATMIDVGLKQHWDAEVRLCSEPKKCSHTIQAGSSEIGHSTMLFTSGFVTAYRHDLVPGGTLSSSYFSSRGKNHLMLVPLTDLRANFDGTEEDLKAGQVYASEAAQVEVTATKLAARWVMLRVETAKHRD